MNKKTLRQSMRRALTGSPLKVQAGGLPFAARPRVKPNGSTSTTGSPCFPSTGQPSASHTTVVVFLRGAIDGLSVVAPMDISSGSVAADSFYVAERQTPLSDPPKPTPQLAIPLPVPNAPDGSIALTDSNGAPISWMLSDGARAAHEMYQAGDLAFIHGVGSPVENNGSHFFSQDFMEDGTELSAMGSDGLGWAGRAMTKISSSGIWRGMSYGKLLPRTLFGAPKTIAIPDPTQYDLNGEANSKDLRKLMLYYMVDGSDEPTKSAGVDSLFTVEQINDPAIFAKGSNETYPSSEFGDQLRNVQKLIQASADPNIDVNLETVMIDYGGWDDHANMGPTPDTTSDPSSEALHLRMKDLFESMRAFYRDLKCQAPDARYTFIVMTEFGRRITANGDAGVDHGKGGLMMVMGSEGINGQNVYSMLPNGVEGGGDIPGWGGLEVHKELQIGTGGTTPYPPSYNVQNTIDYRRILGEFLEKRSMLSLMDAQGSFPGYGYGSGNSQTAPLGVFV